MVADKKDGQNYQNKIQPKRNQKKKINMSSKISPKCRELITVCFLHLLKALVLMLLTYKYSRRRGAVFPVNRIHLGGPPKNFLCTFLSIYFSLKSVTVLHLCDNVCFTYNVPNPKFALFKYSLNPCSFLSLFPPSHQYFLPSLFPSFFLCNGAFKCSHRLEKRTP